MCFENIPEGKKILQSRIDEKYIDALVAKDKGNSQYTYDKYLLKPIKGLI